MRNQGKVMNHDKSRLYPTEELYHQGDHFFDELLMACEKAQEQILIEAYTFETDELGMRLLKVLNRKASEGVEVKILIDAIGSFKFKRKILKKYSDLELRFYNPLPLQSLGSRKSFKSTLNQIFIGLFCINNRNHRKLYLIDQSIAFIGSINITSHHSYRIRGERSWRDSGLKIIDHNCHLLLDSFQHNWNHHLRPIHKYQSKTWYKEIRRSRYRMNHCRKARFRFHQDLIQKIYQAKRRIWITNPYFVPTEEFCKALKDASQRDVDIKILIPRKSDMKLFPLINSLTGRKLVENKIKIFEYLPRILHSKIMIIDDWCSLGSSNLNSRSFKHDLELDIILEDSINIGRLTRQFLDDLTQSVQLEKHDIMSLYGKHFFKGNFLRLIKYWL